MSAFLEPPEPRRDQGGAPPPPAAVPGPSPARRPKRVPRGLTAVLVGLGVLVVAASVGFGLTASRAADREHDTAVRWRDRSERQDEVIADLDQQRADAVADAAEAVTESNRLRAELEASEAAHEQLATAYDELSATLAATEQLVAEQAGVAAMSRDRAALGS
jgi:hypothetical protein